jgi:hypothetical protein
MSRESAKRQLLWSWLIPELIRGHFFDGGNGVFLATGQGIAKHRRNGVLGLLSEDNGRGDEEQ